MSGIPPIFQSLSVGSDKEKVRAFNDLIRKYSSDEDSYEANDAVRSLVGINKVDEVIGVLVQEYNQASKLDLKLRILKVVGWLFSKLWVDDTVTDEDMVAIFGVHSRQAVDIFVQCLYGSHLTPKLWTFLSLIHQAIPSVILCSDRCRYNCLLVELLDGLTFVCTGISPSERQHSTSVGASASASAAATAAAWIKNPIQVHQSFLTALLNIMYQVVCHRRRDTNLVILLRRHTVKLVKFIIEHYLCHTAHILAVYALHLLQVLYPAQFISNIPADCCGCKSMTCTPGVDNNCSTGGGNRCVHLRYEFTCGDLSPDDEPYFEQFSDSMAAHIPAIMGHIR